MASGGTSKITFRLTDSKKEAVCGICEPSYSARRDYMKIDHFPRVHPGKRYIEKGERPISFALFQRPRPRKDSVEETDNVFDAEAVEVEPGNIQNKLQEAHAIDKGVSNVELMETMLRLEKMMVDNLKTKLEPGIVIGDTDMKEKELVVQGSKTVQELCMRAGLTTFESEGKFICDVCHHDDLTDANVRKLGAFSYNIFKH